MCIAHGGGVAARWLAVGNSGGHGAHLADARTLIAALPTTEGGKKGVSGFGRDDSSLDSQLKDRLWRDKWVTVKAAEEQKSQTIISHRDYIWQSVTAIRHYCSKNRAACVSESHNKKQRTQHIPDQTNSSSKRLKISM